MGYDFRTVEERWQARWSEDRVFKAVPDPSREKFYCLEMLPYPSGRIHVGHVRNYAIGDAFAWYWRLRGRNVFHPIGWDAMGLPAENAAIRNGVPPAEWTLHNIAQMKRQLQRLGISYDWDTETATCDPAYYRWNQWFFLRMLERGLAYRAQRKLNWCPQCATVLAEAQVTPAGCCWRHEDTLVEKKDLTQWFVRITDYTPRLVDNLARLEEGWPERVLTLQRHWLGRSEGCRFAFAVDGPVDGQPAAIEVFTTRVDTVYGCAAVFVAAGHPLVPRLAAGTSREDEVATFVAAELAANDDPETREKRGVFTGRHAINPFNGDRVPIWAANFVLADFGTGAVFAQPAHDQRDFEFARRYGLALRPVIHADGAALAEGATMEEAFTEYGVLANSGPFDGLTSAEARVRMAAYAQEHGFGRPETQYRLKDWGISRQRYWGTPIPVVYCDACGIVPVPDADLPVVLPHVPDWKGQTGSPLAQIKAFVETTCPTCGAPARRETDTMDTFVDSSWYFLRYTDPRNDAAPFDAARAGYFMPIDLYIGGVEHATGHLVYFRFWTMFLRDLGLLPFDEPARRLFTQGMVRAKSYRCPVHDYVRVHEVAFDGETPRCPHDGQELTVHVDKMSKSKLNDSDLDHLVETHGADAVRLSVLFGGPPSQDLDWSEGSIEGTFRFVQRIARLIERVGAAVRDTPADAAGRLAAGDAPADVLKLRRTTHRTIARVTRDVEIEFQLNTAIAAQMELVNELYRQTEGQAVPAGSPKAAAVAEALRALVVLLAPFAPHAAEEFHAQLGGAGLVARARWPEADPALLVEDEVVLPVQVLGKLRGNVTVPRGAGEDVARQAARQRHRPARRGRGRRAGGREGGPAAREAPRGPAAGPRGSGARPARQPGGEGMRPGGEGMRRRAAGGSRRGGPWAALRFGTRGLPETGAVPDAGRPKGRPYIVPVVLVVAAAAAFVALPGCGYHLAGRATTSSFLPPTVQSIGIPPFGNRTDRPRLDQRITEALVNEFVRRGRYRAVPTAQGADAVLEGTVESYREEPVTFTEAGRYSRIQVTVTAQLRLVQTSPEKVLWSQNHFVFAQQYDLPATPTSQTDREIVAFEEIARDFARSAVSSILEGF